MTSAGIEAVAAGCPNLQHLNLQHPNLQHLNLQHPNLQHLNPNLQHLNLADTDVTNDGLKAVAAGCPNLQYLNLT